MISKLRLPDKTITVDEEVIVEGEIPIDALKSIQLQHKYMVEAFPEAFRWGSNKFYIFNTVEWAKKMAISLNCWIPPQFERPEEISPTMWSITTVCGESRDGSRTISFLNWPSFQKCDPAEIRLVTGFDEWQYQAAQEGDGSLVQNYYYKGRTVYGINNPLPAWYEQGGQSALSSIALAIQTRTWRQSSLAQGRVATCGDKKVEDSSFYNANPNLGGCHYQLGRIATELMIALYGFDSPISWQKNIMIHPISSREKFLSTWETTFQETFGEPITKFYEFANAYVEYLKSGGRSKLPKEFLERMDKSN